MSLRGGKLLGKEKGVDCLVCWLLGEEYVKEMGLEECAGERYRPLGGVAGRGSLQGLGLGIREEEPAVGGWLQP